MIKYCKLLLVILMILGLTAVFCACGESYKIDNSGTQITGSDKVYNIATDSGWQPIKLGNMIGHCSGTNNIIYSIDGDNDENTIVLEEPLSEFPILFIKEDFIIPRISVQDIDEIEWVQYPENKDKHIVSQKKSIDRILSCLS